MKLMVISISVLMSFNLFRYLWTCDGLFREVVVCIFLLSISCHSFHAYMFRVPFLFCLTLKGKKKFLLFNRATVLLNLYFFVPRSRRFYFRSAHVFTSSCSFLYLV